MAFKIDPKIASKIAPQIAQKIASKADIKLQGVKAISGKRFKLIFSVFI